MNFFESQPHVVVLYFFPLSNPTSFLAADLRGLVRGERPSGLSGEPWETTVLPGQEVELEETLPRDTFSLGVVADFYRGPSRGLVQELSCGWFGGERLVLTPSDLQVAG